ncbi:FecR family protein [Sinomicrobium sp.]
MDDEILIRFVKGQLFGKEKSEVINWIRRSEANQEHYNMLVARYSASQFNSKSLDTIKSYQKVNRATRRFKPTDIQKTLGAAAVLLIGVLLFGVLKPDTLDVFDGGDGQLVRAVTPRGVSRTVTLPDGTVVQLNVDSELSYPKEFQDSIREVHLIGEAYFEVKRDEQRPFVVYAGEMNVRVLGTSFNVRSYRNDSEIKTTLVEGSVKLENNNMKPIILEPMQTALFDRSEKQLDIRDISVEEAVSWKSGKLVFKGTPLKDVLEDLERKYDVHFRVDDSSLYDNLFTGTFDNLSVEEVLRVFRISSSISFDKKGGEIILYKNRR